MKLPQVDRTVALFAAGIAIVVFLMASLLASVGATRETTADVLEEVREGTVAHSADVRQHRHANQTDHDAIRSDLACVVELALLLSDPKRDRSRAVEPPSRCRLAPDAPPGVIDAPTEPVR